MSYPCGIGFYGHETLLEAGFRYTAYLEVSDLHVYTRKDGDRLEVVVRTQDNFGDSARFLHCEGFMSLRELRHSYWGDVDTGYIFCPDRQAMLDVFNVLSEWFDV